MVKKYLFVAVLSIAFTLILVLIYSKFNHTVPVSDPTVVVPTPTSIAAIPTTQIPTLSVSNNHLPLFAYLAKDNLYIFDQNKNVSKQVTVNGSITQFHWSKNGQYLYWMAKYLVNQDTYKYTFARGQFPDFKVEILVDADMSTFNAGNEIYDFMPIVKNNSLIVTSKRGLYSLSDFRNRLANSTKQIANYKPIEGMPEGIYESIAINDIDPKENYLLVNYCAWEGCYDMGYLNLGSSKYTSFPKVYENAPGISQFSSSGQEILISGGGNEMTGGNTKETLLSFPSLNVLYQVNYDVDPSDVGGASFVDDHTIALFYGVNNFRVNNAHRLGISLYNFKNKIEEAYIPLDSNLFRDKAYFYLGNLFVNRQQMLVRTDYNSTTDVLIINLSPNSAADISKLTLPASTEGHYLTQPQ